MAQDITAASLNELRRAISFDHKATVDIDLAEAPETSARPGEVKRMIVAIGAVSRCGYDNVRDESYMRNSVPCCHSVTIWLARK